MKPTPCDTTGHHYTCAMNVNVCLACGAIESAVAAEEPATGQLIPLVGATNTCCSVDDKTC